MTLREIKKGKKQSCTLYFSDGGRLLIPCSFVERYHLTIDMEFTDAGRKQLADLAVKGLCWERALRIIAYRPTCSGMLKQKLSKEYPINVVRIMVLRAQEKGLIDDRAYAERMAEILCREKRYAPKRAALEMRRMEISENLITEMLLPYETDSEEIQEQIAWLLEKKYKRKLENPADYKQMQTVWRGLLQRGYGSEQIQRALEQYRKGEK